LQQGQVFIATAMDEYSRRFLRGLDISHKIILQKKNRDWGFVFHLTRSGGYKIYGNVIKRHLTHLNIFYESKTNMRHSARMPGINFLQQK
jgi:hypothetical protein